MEKIKIFNLSPAEIDRKFLDFLVPILKNNEVEATVENLPTQGMTWPQLQKLLVDAKGAILDIGTSRQIIHQIPTLPADVRILHCADSMFFTEGKWWPRINLKEAIRTLIVKKARSVDIKESAYIIGEGAVLRMLASLAAEFGFSKIYLVGLSEDDILSQMEDLKRSYIGVDWRALETHQLTMQTSGATLLINSLSIAENQVVMGDLAYFNFMKSQGVVVDLNVLPIENALLEEAERANLRTLSGFEVRTQQDLIFIERLGYLPLISVEAYATKWREYLTSQP